MAEPGFGLFCPQKILRTEDRASRRGSSVPDTCVPSDRPGPYPRVQRSSPHARPHLQEAGHARKTALTCGVSGSGDPGGGAFRQVWPTWFGGDGVVRGHFEIGDSREREKPARSDASASRGCPGAWRACTCPAGLRGVGSTDPAVGPAAPQVNSGRPGAQGADAERGEGLGGNSRGGRRGRECGFTLTGNPAPRGAASPRGRARAPWTGRPSRPGLARPVPRGQSGTPGRLGSGRGEPLHADRFPRGHRTGRHPRRRPEVPVGPPVSPPSLVASPRRAARPLRAAARTPRPQEWRTRSPAGREGCVRLRLTGSS